MRNYKQHIFTHDENERIILTEHFYAWKQGKSHYQIYCHKIPSMYTPPPQAVGTDDNLLIFRLHRKHLKKLMSYSPEPLTLKEAQEIAWKYYQITGLRQ